jgi:C-terminal processing protease CtpA/Prc
LYDAFCKDRSGIQANYRSGALDVIFVAPGSPASRSGWKIGDRIIAINRRPIGPEYPP